MRQPLTIDGALPAPARARLWPRLAAALHVEPVLLLETLLIGALGLSTLFGLAFWAGRDAAPAWAQVVENGGDHISIERFAETIAASPEQVVLVDVRPEEEFAGWHLPGAVNLDLPALLGPRGARVLDEADGKLVVLMSNGMVHPAQAWVELTRRGRRNVRVLEGGLADFKLQALTPPSLRGPMSRGRAEREVARFHAMQSWLHSGR
jgi:rhodanese-related sulfurtransferase